MANLKLPEYDFSIDPEDAGFNQRFSYESLLNYFDRRIPKKELEASIKEFEDEKEALNNAIKRALPVLRKQSLLAAFLIWSKKNYIKEGFPDYAKIFVEKNIVPFEDEKGHLLIINNIKEQFLLDILDNIRCRRDFELWQREMMVLAFLDFVNWVGATTRLSSFQVRDRDRERVFLSRSLEYDDFIKFLGQLDFKCQLVAKLLYFGGDRTLAEILNIQIDDVYLSSHSIHFKNETTSYPKHVLEDIKNLIGDHKTGKIFAGKRNSSLNPATIFRNFKEASVKLGLKEDYTPKALTMQ